MPKQRLLLLTIALMGLSARAELPPGDMARGRLVFAACRTCHYPEKEVGHHNGPSLFNVFGRKAGGTDFAHYSPVMMASGLIWTPDLLDFWLANPHVFLKGNTMLTVPIPSAQDRSDLIEYLKQFRE